MKSVLRAGKLVTALDLKSKENYASFTFEVYNLKKKKNRHQRGPEKCFWDSHSNVNHLLKTAYEVPTICRTQIFQWFLSQPDMESLVETGKAMSSHVLALMQLHENGA